MSTMPSLVRILRLSHSGIILTAAARINAHGFVKSAPYASKYRDTASSSTQPARPDELLFRRKNAPMRYEENDFYYANESLPPDRPLPDSELLAAIHAYAADFYRHATKNRGLSDRQSMDETAMIAVGILVEEMAKEALGETGDLVLVEGEHISRGGSELLPGNAGRMGQNPDQVIILDDLGENMDNPVQDNRSKRSRSVITSGDDLGSVEERSSKRRKASHEMDTENNTQP